MQGGGAMCGSGGVQPDGSPEPGPLVLTWVVGSAECLALLCPGPMARVK